VQRLRARAGVSEFALLAMLEWCHRLGSCGPGDASGIWTRSSRFGGAPDDELAGKTLWIVGLGRIGRLSRIAAAPSTCAWSQSTAAPTRRDPDVERVVGLDRLHSALGEADFVVSRAR
jgi:phosphoglycerate dehydrogenase-like enzyme